MSSAIHLGVSTAVGHIAAEDMALYVMRLLSPEEMMAAEAHAASCAECRKELAVVRGDLALYAHSVDRHSPPALARERLMKQVGRERRGAPARSSPLRSVPGPVSDTMQASMPSPAQKPVQRPVQAPDRAEVSASMPAAGIQGKELPAASPIETAAIETVPELMHRDRSEAPLFRSSGYSDRSRFDDVPEEPQKNLAEKAFPWLGWAAAAGLALTATAFYHQRETAQGAIYAKNLQMSQMAADAASSRQLMETLTSGSAMQVELRRQDAKPTPLVRVTYIASQGSLVMLASSLEPLERYKLYELWLIPADGRDPVAAGSFKPDERGNASLILPDMPKGIDAKAFAVTIEDESGPKTTPTMPTVLSGN